MSVMKLAKATLSTVPEVKLTLLPITAAVLNCSKAFPPIVPCEVPPLQ